VIKSSANPVNVKKKTLKTRYKGTVRIPDDIARVHIKQVAKKIEIPPDLVAGFL
jgi:hypothetical protein